MSEVTLTDLNLNNVVEEIFRVLTKKERDVITRRFSLNNKPRQTLESIGQQFSVTRERIRQIEKIALGKLRRTCKTTALKYINQSAFEVLEEAGGVLLEDKLVSSIMEQLGSTNEVDEHIIKLALNVSPDIVKAEKTNVLKPFWRYSKVELKLVKSILSAGIKALKKKSEVMSDGKIIAAVRKAIPELLNSLPDSIIVSSLEVDYSVKRVDEGFGLMSWRHINPRSIRDKAYIVLKNNKKPLHFVEIANKIVEAGFDKKDVTVQAVHNELIRYDQFVLVGRGLYALKEFGYKKGTVAEVIERLLAKKSPMTKQEIIDGVLKQRHVKKGTISLNLQKNPQFVRVGRAVYKLDLSKKK